MNESEVRRHDARLEELTRLFRTSGTSRKAKDFYCPILQHEEPAVLCKGHIISKSIRGRRWVVQRKDVDNFYGSFAEANFIHGVRLRSKATFEDAVDYVIKHHLVRRANLSVLDGGGAKATVHPTRKRVGGWDVAVRPQDDELDMGGDLSLSIDLDVRYETLLACLHTAHLGNFEAAGYAYATSRSGRFVAALLRDVYLRFSRSGARGGRLQVADWDHLAAICGAHTNMVRPLIRIEELNKELMQDPFRSFVLCWCGDDVFASLHLLQADSEWNTVMVYADLDRRAIAMMGATTAISFKATLGRLANGVILAAPLRDDSSTIVWPCGEEPDVNESVPIEEAVARLPP